MSDKAPTPWGHGGSGAPEGDDWVWASSPTDPETGYPEEDMRLFHAPKEVAAEVVRVVNAYAALVEENQRLNKACDLFEANSKEASEVFEVLMAASLIPAQKPGPRLAEVVSGVLAERDEAVKKWHKLVMVLDEISVLTDRVTGVLVGTVKETVVESVKRLKARAETAEKQRDSLRFAADGFIAAVKDAAAHARRPRGGQQVPFHGDFANIQPSALGRLEWWARNFEGVGNFDYAVTYLTAQLNEAQAEVAKLRAVIKQVDELADTQPSYWVVSLIKATQSVLKRGP